MNTFYGPKVVQLDSLEHAVATYNSNCGRKKYEKLVRLYEEFQRRRNLSFEY